MRTVTVTAGETIQLGYQYDNEATQVVFPDTIITAITDVFGTSGTFAIWYRRSGDALGYPIGYPLITYADDQVTWTLTEADMANPGSSQVQLRYIVDEVCVMSQMFMGNVSDSVDIGTDIPAPMEAWADALISAAVSGITDDIKDALLDCFAHVAWIDDQGQTYYDALEDALYPPVPVSSVTVTPSTFQISSIGGTQQLTATILPSSAQATVSWSSSDTSVATVSESGLVTSVAVGTATITATADGVTGTAACTVALPTLSSISAVYTQSGTVYNTDSLDSLKDDLVVTATWSDSSTTTVPSTDYTLSGTLTVGTSTITVSYGGKTDTFSVTVSGAPLIPAEYQQVEYVGFDGNSRIVTDVTPANLNELYKVSATVGVNQATSEEFILGFCGNAARTELYNNNQANKMYYYCGSGEGVTISNIQDLYTYPVDVDVKHDKNGIGVNFDLSVNGNDYNATGTVTSLLSATDHFTFGSGKIASQNYGFKGKIYSCVVYSDLAGTTKIGEFIPCYRKSDGVIGIYDRINETFYVNAGTGTLTKGSDV